MTEDIEQPRESYELSKFAFLARRRFWYFLLPFFAGWLVIWGASWLMPPQYKSSTVILVEQPTMPKDYVMPNVSDDLQDRLESIQQQILSRTRLLRIIEQLNLYSRERSHRNPDERVEYMRKNIEVNLVRDENQRQVTAFTVAFLNRDPQTAQKVTSQLTDLFISENLETRQHESADTTNFLESQLEEARKSLAVQEQKVREFKDKHPGELPTQLESNIQILTGIQNQLQNEQDALNAAKQQNTYLESLLTQYHGLKTGGTSAPGGGLPAIDQELAREQAQLNDLKARYTDKYPDVRKMAEQIASTKQMRDQMLAASKTASGDDTNEAPSADDPTVSQLKSQLRANQLEIANRQKTIAGLQAKVNAYQGHLNQEPVIEQQYVDLTRGYEQSKTSYDDLLKKKNASQMATSMELRQQGEHFRILDPPSLPLKPDSPNRLKMCGLGLGIGLLLGVVSVAVAELIDGKLYDEGSLKKLLPVAVIAEIPPLYSAAELAADRNNVRRQWVAASVAGTIMLCGSAISLFRG